MPEGDEVSVSSDRQTVGDYGGKDLSRILSLSDGIFGFAMTLMVLTLVVPVAPTGANAPSNLSSWLSGQLGMEQGAFSWYVLGFVLIAVWWIAHHALFTHIVRWDRAVVGLNLAFLLTIAVAPFFIELLERFDSTETAVFDYAASQLVTSLVFGGLTVYANRRAGILDAHITREERNLYEERALYRSLIFLGALGIAVIDYHYALFILLATLLVQARRGIRKKRPKAGDPGTPPVTATAPGAPAAGAPLPPS